MSANPGIAIDPVLSSMRSSADQKPMNTNTSGDNSPQLPPELSFTDVTLDSAADPASAQALEEALQQASAMNGDGSNNSQSDGHLSAPNQNGGVKRDQPFSRSPELRVSHKLAERKRRKEMKDMFDELATLLPAERGSRSSKWEVLSRTIEYIQSLKNTNNDLLRDLDKTRRELEMLKGGGAAPAPAPAQQNNSSSFQPYNLAGTAFPMNPTQNADPSTTNNAAPANNAGSAGVQQTNTNPMPGVGVGVGVGKSTTTAQNGNVQQGMQVDGAETTQ